MMLRSLSMTKIVKRCTICNNFGEKKAYHRKMIGRFGNYSLAKTQDVNNVGFPPVDTKIIQL